LVAKLSCVKPGEGWLGPGTGKERGITLESEEAASEPPGPEPASSAEAIVREGPIVQIIALVKPFRASAVLAALAEVPVLGGTIREAMGYGRQKNRLSRYLGSEYDASFVPKVEFSFFVAQEHAEAAVAAIAAAARTGQIGDGKILILPCYPRHLSWQPEA